MTDTPSNPERDANWGRVARLYLSLERRQAHFMTLELWDRWKAASHDPLKLLDLLLDVDEELTRPKRRGPKPKLRLTVPPAGPAGRPRVWTPEHARALLIVEDVGRGLLLQHRGRVTQYDALLEGYKNLSATKPLSAAQMRECRSLARKGARRLSDARKIMKIPSGYPRRIQRE
jgi:hypothetical protein